MHKDSQAQVAQEKQTCVDQENVHPFFHFLLVRKVWQLVSGLQVFSGIFRKLVLYQNPERC
jgi:hypothetical protein